jgi:hypothetical protein
VEFKALVRAGDMVKAVCTVTEWNENKKHAEIKTQYFDGDTLVLDHKATLVVPTSG